MTRTAARPGWVRVGRAAALIYAGLALGLVAADFPHRFAELRTYCLTLCEAGRLPPTEAASLARLGLSLDAYAIYTLGLYLLLAVVCWAVAALLLWRKSGEGAALLAAIALLALGASNGLTLNTVLPVWQPVFVILLLTGYFALTYLFFLFPDGRFVPRWIRWVFAPWVLWLVGGLARVVIAGGNLPPLFWAVLTLLTLAVFAAGGLAQIYRFARVSGPVQRQQTKWVVTGFALVVIIEVVWAAYTDLVLPALGQPAPSGVVYEMSSSLVDVLSLLLVPSSLGIAIFRYRLWDIDLLIRRTLIYSLSTVLLALAYFGSVLVLQTAFGLLTGQTQSTLVTVLSTLVIAALFVPVRARVQAGIDRRFYRRKYDAARTLAVFGASLRDEVEIEALQERLLGVVDETMQPDGITLWLKSR